MNRQYYPSLDGLRAIAAMIVLFAHGGAPYPRSGGVGVDIFFVLSGFLITTILAAEYGRYGSISFKTFYARRMLRLVPCLVLTCALVALLGLVMGQGASGKEIAIALTYTANWAMAIYRIDMSSLAHCWSLSCEEQFYLMWPLVILLLEKSTRNLFAKFAVLFSCSLLLAFYRAEMVWFLQPTRIYYGLDTHMDGLVLGSALSYAVEILRNSGELRKSLSILLGYVACPLSIAILVIVMDRFHWSHYQMVWYGFFLVACASGDNHSRFGHWKTFAYRWLAFVFPIVYLGRISYGLYLLHFPICRAIDHALPDPQFAVAFPLKMVASVAVASLSFHFVESSFLKMKARFEVGARRHVGDNSVRQFRRR